MITPAALARRLASLEVVVDEVSHRARHVAAAGYPGGPRPSLELRLAGWGVVGAGEHVGWSLDGADEVARLVAGALAGRRGSVGALTARCAHADPYTRAAVEGALIDLALAQARLSWVDVVERPEGALRHLISFDACADPAARLAAIRAHNPKARFKIDVDPAWTDAAIARLAASEAVAVVDFKGRGDAALVARVAGRMDGVLVEDPPAALPIVAGRTGRDQGIVDERAVAEALAAGAAINFKAPRMGGWFALLAGLEPALAAHARVYFGGMFEVGCGRRQAQLLAALFAADAEHDLAPIPPGDLDARPSSPLRLRFAAHRFG